MIDNAHHDAHVTAGWHVLSQMLQWPDDVPEVTRLVGVDDFYLQPQRSLFVALIENPRASATEYARETGLGAEVIEGWRSGFERPVKRTDVDHYGLILRRFAVDYRTALKLRDALEVVGRPSSEESVPAMVHEILADYAGAVPLKKLTTFTDVLAKDLPPRDWIFEGLLAKGWTMVLVGFEGAGKSTFLRQLGFCAAAGLRNPFSFSRQYKDPKRVLVIDVENLEEELDREWHDLGRREWPNATTEVNNVQRVLEAETLFIQRPPFGLDITSTSGFATLHSYCRLAEPDLLCIGPLYFLQPKAGGRSDEEVAIEVVMQLQRIRDEFGCAIVMETHAPKGDGPHRRAISFGSSVYLRWPGIQLGLMPDPDTPGAYLLEKNRGHRYSDAEWPEQVFRSKPGQDFRYWTLSPASVNR